MADLKNGTTINGYLALNSYNYPLFIKELNNLTINGVVTQTSAPSADNDLMRKIDVEEYAQPLGYGDDIYGKLLSNNSWTGTNTFNQATYYSVGTEGDVIINKSFSLLNNTNTQYILLCRNDANNDVSGKIRFNRTSNSYQSSIIETIITSSISSMISGSIITHQIQESDETYSLVTVNYDDGSNVLSYVAIKCVGSLYIATGNALFSGKLLSSGLSLVAVNTVTDELSLNCLSKISINGKLITPGIPTEDEELRMKN